jgi:hypothetical protein
LPAECKKEKVNGDDRSHGAKAHAYVITHPRVSDKIRDRALEKLQSINVTDRAAMVAYLEVVMYYRRKFMSSERLTSEELMSIEVLTQNVFEGCSVTLEDNGWAVPEYSMNNEHLLPWSQPRGEGSPGAAARSPHQPLHQRRLERSLIDYEDAAGRPQHQRAQGKAEQELTLSKEEDREEASGSLWRDGKGVPFPRRRRHDEEDVHDLPHPRGERTAEVWVLAGKSSSHISSMFDPSNADGLGQFAEFTGSSTFLMDIYATALGARSRAS